LPDYFIPIDRLSFFHKQPELKTAAFDQDSGSPSESLSIGLQLYLSLYNNHYKLEIDSVNKFCISCYTLFDLQPIYEECFQEFPFHSVFSREDGSCFSESVLDSIPMRGI